MITIIVLSSDGYSDCWDPFFKLFKKYFEGVEGFEILLSSNLKTFESENLNVRTVCFGHKMSWSERLKKCLDMAEHNVVMVLVEDFFLRSKIDYNIFEEIIKLIIQNDEIDHIRLMNKKGSFEVKECDFKNLEEIKRYSHHRFLFLPALWKKDILKLYLKNFETPYLAEVMGNYRSYIRKDGFYSISSHFVDNHGHIYDSAGSGAIYKGKWGLWVDSFLKENNIYIDLSIRGIATEEYKKQVRVKTKLNLLKNPILPLRSFVSIVIQLFTEQFTKSNN